MANNVITAVFSSSNITYTKPAYQYDYGMILRFSGIELPQAYEVHFSNTEFCGESISQIGDESGVTIPDEMFLSGSPIYAWTFLHTDEDDGETVYKTVISINKRAQPSDIEPTPVQQDVITQAIAALNTAVEQTAADVISAGESATAAANSADAAGQAKDDAVEAQGKAEDAQEAAENAQEAAETAQGKAEDAQEAAEQAAGAVLGLTADASVDANTGTPSVEVNVSTVSDHKNMSFSFHNLKGVPGDPGEPGDDGFSPVVSVSSITGGHEVAVTDKNGTQTFDVMDGTDGEDGVSPTVTVTEISGGHNVEITDAQGTTDFDVMDGEVSEQDLEDALIDKADVITSSASGEIVTIADGGNNLPVVDLSVSLLPVQSGSGDPSPDNIRPISGWTGVDINHTGKNLFNATANPIEQGQINNGADASATTMVRCNGYISVKPSTKYTLSSNVPYCLVLYYDANKTYLRNNGAWGTTGSIAFTTDADVAYIRFMLAKSYQASGSGSVTVSPSDITWTQIEYGLTATTYEPYQGELIPISWQSSAGTVYGGTLNLVSGVLSSEYKIVTPSGCDTGSRAYARYVLGSLGYANVNIKSYSNMLIRFTGTASQIPPGYFQLMNSSSYDKSQINFCFVECRGSSSSETRSLNAQKIQELRDAGTPLQFVFKLTTPITYQLTPNQVSTFIGRNSFWSSPTMQIDLEYRADTKLYIENLTKPSEDDMVANANITSGSFFMVGNRLFLSTVAIAQVSTIIPGTNCTEISLADALNSLNS